MVNFISLWLSFFRVAERYESEIYFDSDLLLSFDIYHIEEDLYAPNSIILTYLHSVQTFNGTSLTNIAGKAADFEYREGIGEDARFYSVTHFTQIDDKQILVRDRYNRCLRLINRETRQTSRFYGNCAGMYDSTTPDPQNICTTATTSTAPTTTSTAPTTATTAPTTTTTAAAITTSTYAYTTHNEIFTTTDYYSLREGYIPSDFYIDYKNPNQLLVRYFDNPDGYDYDYDYQNHHQSSYSPHLLATIDIECKDFRKFAPWTSRFRMSILNWIQEKFSGNIYFMMRYTNQYVRLGYVDYDSKDWILFPICGSTEGPLGSFYCGRYADYIMTFASLNILLIRGMHNYSPILMVNTTSNNTIQSNINPSSITTFLAFGDAVYTAHGGNIYKWHGLYSYIEVYYYVYINYGNGLSLSIKPKLLLIGLEPWTSIFQFHMTKSRIRFDNIFWFISLLSTRLPNKVFQNKLAR